MDLASLAIFRTVAKEQGITRAAERLGRVPSNVTTRIQQLETEIGVALFQRDKKRMLLTQEGETFLEYADRILNLADEARQVVNPSVPCGTLRVGSMESTVASRLPVPLAAYNKAWPDVTIELSTAPTRQLIDALLARRIDCALIAVPSGEWWLEPGTLDTHALFGEQLVLLLPPGHPDIRHASDIKPKALAAFAPGCTYRMLAEEWLTGFGSIKEHFAVQEVGSYHAMFACTAAGSCISIMPRSVVDLMRHLGPIKEHPLMTVDTVLACRPGFETPAFSEFHKTLETASDIKK
ncbi:LysR family transcriptional regulator [Thalassospira lucentensis]|uniref:LysR family transcriptional regulator n=1 Tax=Thalassospira lucentensis TaxID=168935 RepID=A0A358HS44_9PROT|nr:LysR family transcriptional regulator [Thalassospira lucentensis]HBU97963.1 LysR family transcriptional regulator [Thalassospira lucentensis]HCW68832.1 LysR family transcriptional regulator [Thalassospira lucentensis]